MVTRRLNAGDFQELNAVTITLRIGLALIIGAFWEWREKFGSSRPDFGRICWYV
ncbi:hypothetical protein [Lacrimispora brassicae]